ncbi:RNA polymerase sigma factor [Luteimicrobium sp. DT211]|uniref:RNA polymerase sigma factor n=1 Tax=Luteimicrobium sp. DT211 TaxID=3393412 RepID=UPI003CF32C5E
MGAHGLSATEDDARAALEAAVRASYGRVLALLAAWCGDLDLAEDALADAVERALRTWPAAGVPDNPAGWLHRVARRRALDVLRSASRRTSRPLGEATEPADLGPGPEGTDPDGLPDRRLELLFVCAHPAIDPAVRAPLMLQTVLGLDAARIAAAFAVPTATMAQRLVRAKRRIRDARIPFRVPGRDELGRRLPAVLEAIYGAYTIDWSRTAGPQVRESLAVEARELALVLASLLDDAEALGLAALLCLSSARLGARVVGGVLVPLDDQDTGRWDAELVERGEALLRRAHANLAPGWADAGLPGPGRFQLEAALQSAHCARARTGRTDRVAVLRLHRALVEVAPTLGAVVALAAATAHVEGPRAGLDVLDPLAARCRAFQPYWATRGDLLAHAGDDAAARAAFGRAVDLTTDPPSRRHLERRLASLG